MKRLPILTVLVAALTVVVHISPTLTDGLQFQRDAIAQGQVWRIVTGHFTHFGADHLKWDLVAFLLFGTLVETRSRLAWTVCVLAGAVVISVGIGAFQPRFTHYRGLSGLDSAFFACLAVEQLRAGWRARDRTLVGIALTACLGLFAKTTFELVTGQTVFVDAGNAFEPVPLAHLLGTALGVIAAWAGSSRASSTTFIIKVTERLKSPNTRPVASPP